MLVTSGLPRRTSLGIIGTSFLSDCWAAVEGKPNAAQAASIKPNTDFVRKESGDTVSSNSYLSIKDANAFVN
jgi:hypothetical protein